jgi:hypothetical protein
MYLIALREALLTLGYRHAYHTFDAVMGNTYDCKLWTDMINAKLAGNPPGRADFDRILGHCQVSGLFQVFLFLFSWLTVSLIGRVGYAGCLLCRRAA